MDAEKTGRALFVALFLLTLYLMFLVFKPFLSGIAWAAVLAVICYPLYVRVLRVLRGRRALTSVLLSLAVATLIVAPVLLLVLNVGQSLVRGYEYLEASYRQAGPGGPLDRLPILAEARVRLLRYGIDLERYDIEGMTLSALQTLGNKVVGQAADAVRNVASALLTLVVLLLTLAVLFYEGPAFVAVVRRYLPLDEVDRDEVLRQLGEVTRSVFIGVLLTSAVQGILAGLGFAFVGIPEPATFGAATFLCALLPGGTAIVWIPAVAWLFFSGHTVKGFVLLAWCGLLVSTIDNVLRPLLVGRSVTMHTLLVFFGIFGGMVAFGLIGLFTGPLVITLFLFLLEVLRRDLFPEPPPSPGGPRST